MSFELPSTVLLFSCISSNLWLNPSSKLFISFIVLFRVSSWLFFKPFISLFWGSLFVDLPCFNSLSRISFSSLSVCVCVLVAQSCPTLCNPMDCGPPGSSVHGTLQARILEWVAIPFSRGSSRPRHRTQVSCTAGRFFAIWATRETCSYNS